jgi:hypothetical protein
MREGTAGSQYSNFSPQNMRLGLNAGLTGSGINNIFIGNNSGVLNTASNNLFIGHQAGNSNTTGQYNAFIGYQAGYRNSDGGDNIYIGYKAGYTITGGFWNNFIGKNSGMNKTAGNWNNFFGMETGANNNGYYNTFIGHISGQQNNGNNNTFLGAQSGVGSGGNDNVFIGYSAGRDATGGDNCFIGTSSGNNNITGTGNVFLGNRSGYNETGSNKLYIDNSNTTTPLIYGDFGSDYIIINGKLGVGVNPTYKIHSVDTNTSGDDPAIFGKHNVTDAYGIGVKGEGGYKGVTGEAVMTSGYGYGVYGSATGGSGSGTRYGVYGTASGGATNWAGYFAGDINVTGTVIKSKDEIKIDHPQDPANRILSHTGVNSDEMINVYNGNIILNGDGKAMIELPEWFESFNTDFRYQLTPLGAPANLYISKEISNNSFEISGGSPNMKVSWQVTGVRKDNYAKLNPIKVETEKNSNDKGFYLHPEAYGLSIEKSVDHKNKKERK